MYYRFKFLLLSLLPVLPLYGCSGTSDIVAEDDSTLIGSAGFESKLSDRGALDARYLVTGGSNAENSSIIQVDGNRFDTTGGKNSFRLHVLSLHYRYTLVNGRKFRLYVAPGAQASYVDIKTRLPETGFSTNETSYGVALRLGMDLSFSERLSLEPELSVAKQSESDRLVSLGMWFNYHLNSNSTIRIGYSGEYLGDGPFSLFEGDNGDGCLTVEINEGDVCEDSRLKASATGLHLGFKYRL